MRVSLIFRHDKWREREIHAAWEQGIRALGGKPADHRAPDKADLLIVWGLPEEHKPLLCDWQAAGKPVLVMDYPYWNRVLRSDTKHGYYKISLNDIHPTQYLMREAHSLERYLVTGGPVIKPWRASGQYIVVAGMGPKGCTMYGQPKGGWDMAAVSTMQAHSQRRIIYRAKPSDKGAMRLAGTIFDEGAQPIERLFADAHTVVTHHGNAVVEALAAGVPVFCAAGVATQMGLSDLTKIDRPLLPDNRKQFFYNLAHWQWRIDEIAVGVPLLSLQDRKLI